MIISIGADTFICDCNCVSTYGTATPVTQDAPLPGPTATYTPTPTRTPTPTNTPTPTTAPTPFAGVYAGRSDGEVIPSWDDGDTWGASIGSIGEGVGALYSWDSQERLFAAGYTSQAIYEYNFGTSTWDAMNGGADGFHTCGTGVCAWYGDWSGEELSYASKIYKIDVGEAVWTQTGSIPCNYTYPIRNGAGSTLVTMGTFCNDICDLDADPLCEYSDGAHAYLSSTDGDSWGQHGTTLIRLGAVAYFGATYDILYYGSVVGVQPMWQTADLGSLPQTYAPHIDVTDSARYLDQEDTTAVWIRDRAGATDGGDLFRSTDGTNFSLKLDLPAWSTSGEIYFGDYFWVPIRIANNGIYRSTNGDSWTEKLDGHFYSVTESDF